MASSTKFWDSSPDIYQDFDSLTSVTNTAVATHTYKPTSRLGARRFQVSINRSVLMNAKSSGQEAMMIEKHIRRLVDRGEVSSHCLSCPKFQRKTIEEPMLDSRVYSFSCGASMDSRPVSHCPDGTTLVMRGNETMEEIIEMTPPNVLDRRVTANANTSPQPVRPAITMNGKRFYIRLDANLNKLFLHEEGSTVARELSIGTTEWELTQANPDRYQPYQKPDEPTITAESELASDVW